MIHTAIANSSHIPFSVNKTETSLPELLVLRFVGDQCVEGTADQLWQTLFAVDCDSTCSLSRILPDEMIESLLSISRTMFPVEPKNEMIWEQRLLHPHFAHVGTPHLPK